MLRSVLVLMPPLEAHAALALQGLLRQQQHCSSTAAGAAGAAVVLRAPRSAAMRAAVAFAAQSSFREQCTFLDCPWR
jgi:hypothetical protein